MKEQLLSTHARGGRATEREALDRQRRFRSMLRMAGRSLLPTWWLPQRGSAQDCGQCEEEREQLNRLVGDCSSFINNEPSLILNHCRAHSPRVPPHQRVQLARAQFRPAAATTNRNEPAQHVRELRHPRCTQCIAIAGRECHNWSVVFRRLRMSTGYSQPITAAISARCKGSLHANSTSIPLQTHGNR